MILKGISKIIFSGAKKLGNTGGKIVKSDIERAAITPNWSHADKIKELKTDSRLSPDYIENLIKNSNNKTDLNAIVNYLKDKDKVDNIPAGKVEQLKKIANEKIENIELKELLKLAKDKGLLSLEDTINLFI